MAANTVERGTLTVTEAAHFLGVSRSHLYELVRTGEVPALSLGTRKVISRAALERMLDQGGKASAAE